MATREELVQALAAADAAGAEDDARFLAGRIKAMDTPARVDPAAVQKDFDDQSFMRKGLTAVTDALQLGGNGLMLGQGDKLRAGVGSLVKGSTYDEELQHQRDLTQAAKVRAGSAGLPLEIAGGMATGNAATKLGADALMGVKTSVLPLWQRMLGQVGAGSVEGAVYGGLQAAGDDTSIPEGITGGGIVGGAAGGIGEGLLSLFARSPARAAATAPSVDDLRAESSQMFRQVEDAGVDINADAIARLNQNLQRNVVDQRAGPRRGSHNATFGELDAILSNTPSMQPAKETAQRVQTYSDGNLRTTTSVNGQPPRTRDVDRVARGDTERTRRVVNMMPDRGMTLEGLEDHRKAARDSTSSIPTERRFGPQIIKQIDDFGKTLTPNDATVRSGANVQDIVKLQGEAREVSHRGKKAKEMADIIRKADIKSKGEGGEGSRIRSKLGDFVADETNLVGYSPDEIQAMHDVINGVGKTSKWRKLEKIFSGPGTHTAAIAAGTGIGSLFGPAGAATGFAAGPTAVRGINLAAGNRADAATKKAMGELADDVARGYKSRRQKGHANASKGEQDALRRLLMLVGLEGPSPE